MPNFNLSREKSDTAWNLISRGKIESVLISFAKQFIGWMKFRAAWPDMQAANNNNSAQSIFDRNCRSAEKKQFSSIFMQITRRHGANMIIVAAPPSRITRRRATLVSSTHLPLNRQSPAPDAVNTLRSHPRLNSPPAGKLQSPHNHYIEWVARVANCNFLPSVYIKNRIIFFLIKNLISFV